MELNKVIVEKDGGNTSNQDVHFCETTKKEGSSFRYVLIVGLVLVVTAATVASIYIVWKTRKSSGSGSVKYTPENVIIAAKMLDAMDMKEDPCKDFHQYACGNWLKNTPIPDSRMRYSRFEKLAETNNLKIKRILNDFIKKRRKATISSLERAAIYYKTCMDTKKIEKIGDKPVRELLAKIGSWSVIDPDFNSSNWNALDALVNVQRNISQPALFNLYVAGDIKRSTENVVVFDQSGISLTRFTYLGNSTYYERRRTAYLKLMRAVVKELGANETGVKLIEKVFQFEKDLAKEMMSILERRSYNNIYRSMTFKEFAKKADIPTEWLQEFANKVFTDTGQTIPLEERIVSFNTDYIKKAYKMFFNLTPEVQSAYIMWHAVKVMAPVVLGKYKDIIDEYQMDVSDTQTPTPRWEVCVTSTLRVFANALSRPFVKEVYDVTAKTMSTEMIKAVKEVFKTNLDSMEWMDDVTKSYAKKKASLMLENIGYPEFIMNDTALEERYNGLEIINGQHFKNYMEQRKFSNMKNYKKRGKPVDKSEWGIPPTDVNAYYAPTENKIGFTAGILQWPFYDKRAPRALAYGAIGMVVGHEISHGFDDQGKDFTIEGNFDTWWTNHSAREFEKKTKCFIDQYSNFSMFGVNIKGKQTLGENLADNGGLRQSYQAYQLWTKKNGREQQLPGLDLTPEQLFFLAFAQVWCTAYREPGAVSQIETGFHTLSNFRVIGTLQNSKEFSEAYNCPVGSRMNPAKKCQIW